LPISTYNQAVSSLLGLGYEVFLPVARTNDIENDIAVRFNRIITRCIIRRASIDSRGLYIAVRSEPEALAYLLSIGFSSVIAVAPQSIGGHLWLLDLVRAANRTIALRKLPCIPAASTGSTLLLRQPDGSHALPSDSAADRFDPNALTEDSVGRPGQPPTEPDPAVRGELENLPSDSPQPPESTEPAIIEPTIEELEAESDKVSDFTDYLSILTGLQSQRSETP
jgi:hypothetical protein